MKCAVWCCVGKCFLLNVLKEDFGECLFQSDISIDRCILLVKLKLKLCY